MDKEKIKQKNSKNNDKKWNKILKNDEFYLLENLKTK